MIKYLILVSLVILLFISSCTQKPETANPTIIIGETEKGNSLTDKNGNIESDKCIAIWSNCNCDYGAFSVDELEYPLIDCDRLCFPHGGKQPEAPKVRLVDGECVILE